MKFFVVPLLVVALSLPSAYSQCAENSTEGCTVEQDEPVYAWLDPRKPIELHNTRSLFHSSDTFEDMKNSVKFFLYNTKTNLARTEIATLNSKRLYLGFKPNLPTKIIIHGWKNSIVSPVEQGIKNAYLKNYDVNVICVDWSKSARKLYPASKEETVIVAKVVSQFIDRLNSELKNDISRLHIIGHSLGAHVSGMAARQVKTGKISRVTGLDPAGPLFTLNAVNERLGVDSAKFVEVIHTCGNELGFEAPLGHVDLYPNNGKSIQPGCGLDIYGVCSHGRSIDIYQEAIQNPNAFVGYSCNNWDTFALGKCYKSATYGIGEQINTRSRGQFYFKTSHKSPYGLGAQ